MPRKQRLVGWLACMSVAICSVGVPLPAFSERKSGAEPFPCQHCACGCKDADACWRDCCCFTTRQKLVWARRHGVTPPAFVVAAARREGCGDKAGAHSCCKSKPRVNMAHATVTRPCCARRAVATATAQEQETRRHSSDVVLLVSKLRCGGIGLSVSMLPPSVVVKAIDFKPVAPELLERSSTADLLYEPPYLAVAAPPPDAARV